MEKLSKEELIALLKENIKCVIPTLKFRKDEFKQEIENIFNSVRNSKFFCICEYNEYKRIYNIYYLDNLKIINDLKNHIFTILIIPSKLIEQQGQEVIDVLKKNITITELYICGGYEKNINQNSARIIRTILDLQQLIVVDLRNNYLSPELGNIFLEYIYLNYSLTNLNLSNNNLGESVKIIADELPHIYSLSTLNLSKNNLGPEQAIRIAKGLKLNDSLVTLNLSDNNLGSIGGNAFASAIRVNTTLTDINLSNNNLGVTGLTQFLFMLCEVEFCNLKKLDLSINDCSKIYTINYGFLLANIIMINTSLEIILFHCNRLGNNKNIGLALAYALKQNNTLKELDLRLNDLEDKNVLLIGNNNTQLTKINLK